MRKQKLSPEAAKKKAERDLRIANTPDREAKRADSQKKRRDAIKNGRDIDGKDYDHNTNRFVSSSKNRAGTQKSGKGGTKNEHAKKLR